MLEAFLTLALVTRGMKMAYSLIYTFLLLLLATYLFLRKHKRRPPGMRVTGSLPPGSMGWPYIGETLQFYSENPNVFFSSKQKRYGEIFKTRLLGCPCVMLASPEAARFVLVTQAHLFKPTYPRSKETLIGPSALFFHQGEYHLRLRKLFQGSLLPDRLRGLVPSIQGVVLSLLNTWVDGQRVVTYHEMKKLSFDVGILVIFGENLDKRFAIELRKNYHIVDKGYNSFPTNIPGTRYHKAIQARKRLGEILSEIIDERRKNRVFDESLLGCLMSSKDDKSEHLSDEQIAHNIIGGLFAARDTTASVMTWIVKYLHDNPKLLEAVKAEQMATEEANENGRRPLTWAQTRSMVLTHKVILESLRMSSIISFTFREAVADVEYKGYIIPKGWKVMPLFRNIHHSPEFFRDPGKFDPSRFQVAPKPNTFLPFGNGVHSCPGNELAKLQMLILIHHLVTKYRWEIFGSQNEIEYAPFPVPKHGLRASFWRLSSNSNSSCTINNNATV